MIIRKIRGRQYFELEIIEDNNEDIIIRIGRRKHHITKQSLYSFLEDLQFYNDDDD